MQLINPHLPVIGGEVYIFFSEARRRDARRHQHLRRATGDNWFVTQRNPPPGMKHDYALSRKEWRWAHRVVGKCCKGA